MIVFTVYMLAGFSDFPKTIKATAFQNKLYIKREQECNTNIENIKKLEKQEMRGL